MNGLAKIGIVAGGCVAFVGGVILLDRLVDPDRGREPAPPPSTIPLPAGDATLGVEHLIGRTPVQAAAAYFQRDDIDQDGFVRYLGERPEGLAFRYGTDFAYRRADAAGNDDGSADLDELSRWIGGLGEVVHEPMTATAAEWFREVLPRT